MRNPLDSRISYLERVKVQSEVLVPILKHLRVELGEARANELIYEALRDWSREVFKEVGSKKRGSAKEKWRQLSDDLEGLIGEDVEFEIIGENSEVWDFDVTGCRYAQFFQDLGEPELGSILSCEVDDHIAAVGNPEVKLSREKTIMKGAKLCNFRYRFSKDDDKGI